MNESFDFRGPAGRLEAVLMHPDGEAAGAAVLCHAHPLHGGMMHFKTVFRAAKALQGAGLAVLRFNFRGVGRSEGAYDRGVGEQDDAGAALTEMERRFPQTPLIIGGFSFGSVVALRVAAREGRVQALLVLGYPLSHEGAGPIVAVRQPCLFVQGEHDDFGLGAELRSLSESSPPPREVVVVPGADHYFTGRLEALQAAVLDWAARRPWRQLP